MVTAEPAAARRRRSRDMTASSAFALPCSSRPYRILGACNPQMAHRALQAEDKIGTMLPCNVIVQQHGGDGVEVSPVDPVASMQAIDNPRLAETAQNVRQMLKSAIDEIGAS